MNSTIVIYKSKYGATKTYAKWLAEAVGCEAVEAKRFDVKRFDEYDTIVFGGGIYATGIAGIALLNKNAEKLKGKRLACFAVGASPFNAQALEEIRKKNLSGALETLPLFYCRGAFDEQRMTGGDKLMIRMLKKMVAKKDPKDYEPWEAALMESLGQPGDWTDRQNLEPIIDFAQ